MNRLKTTHPLSLLTILMVTMGSAIAERPVWSSPLSWLPPVAAC
ncbi:MAG: hypothetical protein PHF56_07105 [Desulfuromonadaceae bacterium]|nr:hypothetical protein [Desulfuromonadaceae bacterium]